MNKKKIFIAAGVVALIALFFVFDLGRFLTLESLKNNRDALTTFYQSNKILMAAAFIVIYVIQTALSLPGAAILSLAAGAVFGAVMGTVYVNIGATAGATAAFLVARYLFREVIQKKFGSRLETINHELETK